MPHQGRNFVKLAGGNPQLSVLKMKKDYFKWDKSNNKKRKNDNLMPQKASCICACWSISSWSQTKTKETVSYPGLLSGWTHCQTDYSWKHLEDTCLQVLMTSLQRFTCMKLASWMKLASPYGLVAWTKFSGRKMRRQRKTSSHLS